MSRTNHDRTTHSGIRLTAAGDPRSIRRIARHEYHRARRADDTRAARLHDRNAIERSMRGEG